jgi:hypothetical protein
VVVVAFAVVFSSGWQNILFCLLGFLLARIVLARWIRQRSPIRRTGG